MRAKRKGSPVRIRFRDGIGNLRPIRKLDTGPAGNVVPAPSRGPESAPKTPIPRASETG